MEKETGKSGRGKRERKERDCETVKCGSVAHRERVEEKTAGGNRERGEGKRIETIETMILRERS